MAVAERPSPAQITPRKIKGYGWHPDLPDPRDRIYNLEEEVKLASALPSKVDLSAKMPPIYNQLQLGSCTGNGIARMLEYEAIAQGEAAVTPSRLFIYYNERVIEGTVSQDSGAQIRDGIKVVVKQGAPPEGEWPYSDADPGPFQKPPPATVYTDATKHEALLYKRVLLSGPGAPLQSALAAGHPIVFGFTVPSYFEDGTWDAARQSLPVPSPNDKFIGGHCVVLSGYDFTRTRFPNPAYQVENSWGPGWGMNGRFWMDAGWFDPHARLANDFWVITRVM
jgi:C1A family cysteine protease